MKKFINEFKEFALKGNVISLAIGVIIGVAFQGMISSLTDNIISPIIGLFSGQNFDTLKIDLLGTTITYGAFITSVINFFIIALVVFFIIKFTNKLLSIGQPKDEEETTTKKCQFCMSEIDIKATRCPHCTSHLEEV